ncbi:MAG: hypothetical protein U1D30_00425 [Planctomycetota bacterium]
MRRVFRIGGILLLLVGIGLTYLEMRRRANVAEQLRLEELRMAELEAKQKSSDPDSLVEKYRQPEAFMELCETLRRNYIAMDERHRQSNHGEVSVSVQLDDKGKEVAEETVAERVWFDKDREYRQYVKREVVGGKTNWTPTAKPRTSEPGKVIFPFTRDEKKGDYEFKLLGHEKMGEKTVLKLEFIPKEPLDAKFKGHFWVDPETHHPVRVDAELAKNPRFVDKVRMVFDYGPAENGAIQARKSSIEGSGGFAFIQRKYRVNTELSDYRPIEDKTDTSSASAVAK